MNLIGQAQGTIALVLSVAIIIMQAFALADAVRHPADAFVRADKRSKPLWLGVTGVALLLGVMTFPNPLSLFTLIGVIGAGIYLADGRPALQSGSGNGGSRGRDSW